MNEQELFIFREHAPGFNRCYFEKSVLLIILVFLLCLLLFCVLRNMLPVSLDCTCLITTSFFSNV